MHQNEAYRIFFSLKKKILKDQNMETRKVKKKNEPKVSKENIKGKHREMIHV